MQNRDDRNDVIVAGAGPAGLAVAAELAFHGVRTIVVEPRAEIAYSRPRAKTTSARTMELFRRWGIAGDIRRAAAFSPSWNRRAVFCDSVMGSVITEFHDIFGLRADELGLAAEAGQQIAQPFVEQVLRTHLESTGLVDFRWGEKVVAFDERSGEAVCTITRPDGSTYPSSARFLLGCDGAKSIIREGIGASFEGSSAPRSNLNVVFRSKSLRPSIGEALHYWVIGPNVPGVIGPLDLQGTWWATLSGVGEVDDEAMIIGMVAELIGLPVGEVDIEVLSTAPWTPRMLLSNRFSGQGQVFLVGESAHVNPPLGGHGFNTSVGDAVNIGWKIAAVLQGWGNDELLASYESERRTVARLTIASAVTNLRAMGDGLAPHEAVIQATKSEEFHSLGLVLGYSYAPCVPDSDSDSDFDVQVYTPSTAPGARLPHVWLSPGRALFDELGSAVTVIHPRDAVARELEGIRQRAAVEGIPLTFVPMPDAPAFNDRDYLVVRPDQHIAWRGEAAAEIDFSLFIRRSTHTRPEESHVR
jgi:2-polyprenyl-6-methoxyphenol hydroxylase-like FAD-dependent oxidoreductase